MQKVVLELKIDFNQQTACGAPVCWSKYTTGRDKPGMTSFKKLRQI